MSTSTSAAIGRFSSQMLTYLGVQKTVQAVNGSFENTFKYATTPTTFVDAGSFLQSQLGTGVVGNYSPTVYNTTVSYFLSRGIGIVYAQTMAAIVIDMATALGISTQSLLEQSEVMSKLQFSSNLYTLLNTLRDPSHQVGSASAALNSASMLSREIRS